MNFGNIILIPKVGDASKIQQYGPICLLNVSFKTFTWQLIESSKWHIKSSGLRKRLSFLEEILWNGLWSCMRPSTSSIGKTSTGSFLRLTSKRLMTRCIGTFFSRSCEGFSATWCNWIKSFVQGGNVAVNVNGQNGSYFQTRKGLRQGDPLSPILFNIVADMLAIIINRAKSEGKVNGVIPHLVEDGFSILRYADDTVIFLDRNLEKARNMKVLLCVFEKLSGLKINFHKNEIFCFGQAKECENAYSELFGCRSGSFPFRYLGLLMHYRKLRNSDWRHIEERFEKRLIGWKGELLSNKCLLSKWLFKLANEDGIWQNLLRNKYLKSKPLGAGIKGPGVSHFWAGLMDVKQVFLSLGSFSIGDGTQVRFWEHTWCGNRPLKFLYPSLFNIVRKKGATVADVMSSTPLNVSFRRGLYRERLNACNELVGRVMSLKLRGGRDVFNWGLNKSGLFTEICQTKIPLKTKIFMWYVKRGVLLTKDNLARRNWSGHQGCCFCNSNESIQHLFFDCRLAKLIWRAVLFRVTFWLRHWAKLQRNKDQVQWLTQGAHNLEVAAFRIFNSFGWQSPARISFV
ncbi:hypothetical protein U9M48_028951 [Paspalum notatum var. saurae]|uniref:Reverse transcriptase domain-containing protein n=1 Tax=Paspalum notatum var. saurae TaxID=547442 RepID=A0AAQ3X1W8_PASNO